MQGDCKIIQGTNKRKVLKPFRPNKEVKTIRKNVFSKMNHKKKLMAFVTVGMVAFLPVSHASEPMKQKSESSWVNRLQLTGMFRLRGDFRNETNQKNRHRSGFRAEVAIEPHIDSGWYLGLEFGTSSGAGGSGTQYLGDSLDPKILKLRSVYIRKELEFLKGGYLEAGKTPAHFYRPLGSQLFWDRDLRPEGTSFGWEGDRANSVRPWVHAGVYWVEEREFAADTHLYALQSGLQVGQVSFTAGVYVFTQLSGFNTLHSTTIPYGNRVDQSGGTLTYQNDFHLVNAGFDFELPSIAGVEIAPFFDSVFNFAASSERFGFLTGVEIGKIKNPGDFNVRLVWRQIQADSILSVFGASFLGDYRSDLAGFQIDSRVRLVKNFDVRANYIDYQFPIGGTMRNQILMIDLDYTF